MRLGIWGAGSWGTALAFAWASGPHTVYLRPREANTAKSLLQNRCNIPYFPDYSFPPQLRIWHPQEDAAVLAELDAVVLAVPAGAVRPIVDQWPGKHVPLCIASKGFDPQSGQLLPLMLQTIEWSAPVLVLSGPSFARDVVAGKPTALVLAAFDETVAAHWSHCLHQPHLRLYASSDPVGVAWGGAHKNVLAIAAGACHALQLGANARAALITRGLMEMRRIGTVYGGLDHTFCGLSGLGDLVLTATDPVSRNFRLGSYLAQGCTLSQAQARIGQVTEGCFTVDHVQKLAQAAGIHLPVSDAVWQLVHGIRPVSELLETLLSREQGWEYGHSF